MNGLLTPRAKDKDFPLELQAIVIIVPDRYYGCEELGQVSEDLRCRCHVNDPWECTRNRTARVGRRRSRVSHRQASDSESHVAHYPTEPRLAHLTSLFLNHVPRG